MNQETHTIGMIGIGQLGLPVAINLVSAGFRVLGFRRTDRDAFVQAGGIALETPAEVAQQSDIVLMCLPGEAAQEAVFTGPDGLLGAIAPGKIVIELGTYTREYKEAQALRLHAAGVRMLEAEVSGSPPLVAERRAALYIGGDEALFEECKPVLDAITAHHFHLGPVGSAVAMKLIANTLVTVHTLAAAEAMNLGIRAGFNPHRVAEVIRQGAGNSAMFTIRAPLMAARTFTPAPGPFKTLHKYLLLAGDMAKRLDSATPLLSAATPYFLRGLEEGMGDEDISAVLKLLEQDSGRAINHQEAP